MYERKRIYILVKTYPTISEKYAELVCTAGVLEDGSWIRLYPVPFRLLNDNQKYPKYTWIEVDAERNKSDFRQESFRPDISTMRVEPRSKKVNWEERRKIVFKNNSAYTNLHELIAKAKMENISLAVFKPKRILGFVVEPTTREWDLKKLESLDAQSRQMSMFKTIDDLKNEFRVVKKIPYKFSYRFEDDSGRQSTLMIEDWEIGMLYLKCLEKACGDEGAAIQKVTQKYFEDFLTKDLYFFLGTTKLFHNVGHNPFIIIGVFYPPYQSANEQLSLFD